MPLTVKISNKKLADVFDKETAQAFSSNGVFLYISGSKLLFKDISSTVLATLKFNPVVLSLFKQGVLGEHQTYTLKTALMAELAKVTPNTVTGSLDGTPPASQPSTGHVKEKTVTQKKIDAVLEKIANGDAITPTKLSGDIQTGPPYKSAITSIPKNNIYGIMNKDTVPLKDATEMYQPTKGTSNGSCYYVVGISPSLVIAARFTPGKISIRVEGKGGQPLNHTERKGLTSAGYDVHEHAYASVHLGYNNDKQVGRKILGAMLLALPVSLFSPYPDIEFIYNKGV